VRFQAWCLGLIPGWGPATAVISLGKKLYPQPIASAINWDLLYDIDQGTAEKQSLADAIIPV